MIKPGFFQAGFIALHSLGDNGGDGDSGGGGNKERERERESQCECAHRKARRKIMMEEPVD